MLMYDVLITFELGTIITPASAIFSDNRILNKPMLLY